MRGYARSVAGLQDVWITRMDATSRLRAAARPGEQRGRKPAEDGSPDDDGATTPAQGT